MKLLRISTAILVMMALPVAAPAQERRVPASPADVRLSYAPIVQRVTQAVADHSGVEIAAIVGRGNVHGVQFHPEKSAGDGEALLARFLRLPGALQ